MTSSYANSNNVPKSSKPVYMVYLKNPKSIPTINNIQNSLFGIENASNITLSSLANNSLSQNSNQSLENQFNSFLKKSH